MQLAHPHIRWKTDNAVSLLENGVQLFPALCAAFDAATTSIHVEMYIFRLDIAGRQILHHLILAAKRGLKVRLVIDGYGSAAEDETIARTLREAGAQCRIYRPEPKHFTLKSFDFMRLRRLHRKIVVVDGMVGFVGGINFEDDYSTADPDVRATDARYDYAVRVTGPIVLDLVEAMDLLWLRTRKYGNGKNGVSSSDNSSSHRSQKNVRSWGQRHLKHLRTRLRYFKRNRTSSNASFSAASNTRTNTAANPSSLNASNKPANMRAAVILRDNLRYRRTIETSYLFHISAAKNEIIIANAYFLPGGKLRRALIDAANRGVKVRLLLQGKIEYQMQYHATRWIYDLFLREGIEIYEYLPSFLHAKVAVIDGVSFVGSSNLDPFSLLLAREANVLIDDAGFTMQLRQSLENAMIRGSRIIELTLYGNRPFLGRIADGLCYLLLRIGVALSGRSDHY
ncbi:cardiolipin synthase ClsB [Zwartia sp.]|uniref:cardiolipin synthase ClsB n=1 Tax=Zwartia sp. TaxID=2978004 RepID=UPI0027228EEE|nr:cardiolipin synthase ClsB [Zwartia sp.]MDO9023581.1 cardiolipin synthase ClsB [Zwartia sp.]